MKFILKSNLTKSLLKWSQDITFPEEIFFATLVRINVKKYVHTGIVEQYHTKQAIQYPLCPRRTLWNYATKNCYGQSKRWMCNLRLIETTKLYCKCYSIKPSQNKKGQKNFQLHHFLNTFSQLPAVKKYSKNGAAGKFFGPSYFDPAL